MTIKIRESAAITIHERAVVVGTALADYAHLPHDGFSVYRSGAHISVPNSYVRGFQSVREVAQWAAAFDVPIIISLSFGGSGKVETNVGLGGVPVAVNAGIGTAQAYELGAVLQRPLTRDVSIEISAADLLAALPAAPEASA